MSLSTPIVLIIFNRPDFTQTVFETIRIAKPKKLLVIADGPRCPEENEKCQKSREIINQIDWNCELLINFSEINLGCGIRVSSGLSWAFSEVEEAIILEDDCLPSPSFFFFCERLLERYRDDIRIMHICGTNFQFGRRRSSYSYYFSKYPYIWGWASWRRAWKHYDYHIKTWPEFKKSDKLKLVCEDQAEQRMWTLRLDLIHKDAKRINTWDRQWFYTCWFQNGFSIIPESNLVTNLGVGHSDATHKSTYSPWVEPWLKWPTYDIWEIKHPPSVIKNREADAYTFDYRFGGLFEKRNDSFYAQLRYKIAKFFLLVKFPNELNIMTYKIYNKFIQN